MEILLIFIILWLMLVVRVLFRSLPKADVDGKSAEIGQFLQQCIAVELQRNNHGAEQEVVRYQQGISN